MLAGVTVLLKLANYAVNTLHYHSYPSHLSCHYPPLSQDWLAHQDLTEDLARVGWTYISSIMRAGRAGHRTEAIKLLEMNNCLE